MSKAEVPDARQVHDLVGEDEWTQSHQVGEQVIFIRSVDSDARHSAVVFDVQTDLNSLFSPKASCPKLRQLLHEEFESVAYAELCEARGSSAPAHFFLAPLIVSTTDVFLRFWACLTEMNLPVAASRPIFTV